MLIHIRHPEYWAIEIKGESLLVHPARGQSRLLSEGIVDVAAAVSAGLIHIVAFGENKDYAWHFFGRESFNRDRVELGQVYGGGARLVSDGAGMIHLLYLAQQSTGRGTILKHRVFSQSWAEPLSVSPNVSTQGSNFSAAWHNDGYLHIVYCCQREQHLYYRVFNPKQGIWSGAIPFSRGRCSYPVLIPATVLYLFWLEEAAKIGLQVRQKETVWSETMLISEQKAHVSGVGFALKEEAWRLFWREGAALYRTAFGDWAGREQEEADQYKFVWAVEGGVMIPAYRAEIAADDVVADMVADTADTVADRVADTVADTAAAETARRQKIVRKQDEEREKKEAEAQAAFMQQSFRVLQEWERLREEIRLWRGETLVAEPVDLGPILNRCERLERRYVSLGQVQKQHMEHSAAELEKIRLDLQRIQRRLHDFEQAQKKRKTGFWHRLLEKD